MTTVGNTTLSAPHIEEAELHGFGPQPWREILKLASGLTCSWADNTGFQVGPCPATSPPYSHLWGWDAEGTVLLRVRLDGDHGIPAVLVREDGACPGVLAAMGSEQVRITERPGLPWPANEKRIKPQPPGVLDQTIHLIQVLGAMPMTFVRHLAAGGANG